MTSMKFDIVGKLTKSTVEKEGTGSAVSTQESSTSEMTAVTPTPESSTSIGESTIVSTSEESTSTLVTTKLSTESPSTSPYSTSESSTPEATTVNSTPIETSETTIVSTSEESTSTLVTTEPSTDSPSTTPSSTSESSTPVTTTVISTPSETSETTVVSTSEESTSTLGTTELSTEIPSTTPSSTSESSTPVATTVISTPLETSETTVVSTSEESTSTLVTTELITDSPSTTPSSTSESSTPVATTVISTPSEISESTTLSTSVESTSTLVTTKLSTESLSTTPSSTSESSTPVATTIISTPLETTVEGPIIVKTENPNQALPPKVFNVTFTITSQPFYPDLQNQNSNLYTNRSEIIIRLLNNLYNHSNINSKFQGCTNVYFREANDGNTVVEVDCRFKNVATAPDVNRIIVYHEFRDNTQNITTLGTFSLDSNSLYVNGYHEGIPSTTATTPTITRSSLTQSKTPPVSSTSTHMTVTSLATTFTVSVTASQDTETPSLDSSTTHRTTSPSTRLTTTSESTTSMVTLISLTPTIITRQPTPSQGEGFNVTFIITNLPFTSAQEDPATAKNISNRLNNVFNESDIRFKFSGCVVQSFSLVNIDQTSVYALCTFQNTTELENVDKVIVYRTFSENTNQISVLGTYTLDTNSLYVNGYHETTPLTTPGPTVKVTPIPTVEEAFNVTFIITNLTFIQELEDPQSDLYKSRTSDIANRLDNMFNNSDISPAFSHCKVKSLSLANFEQTSVYALCTFQNTTELENVDKVIVYRTFSENTNQISVLGTYTLDTNSLYVNGYHETTPLTSKSDLFSCSFGEWDLE
eukprot:gi/632962122/ref/XP_007897135.1/ PREDICTED: flocculation protein FLO11-like [Callorhinchus milii]